uniref:Ubiquinone biosynthesis O-methyltransferase, mitochondrial n=1 Tax=Caenorhabditis tropicalis TaxID=1561998 RepID=A0A1I7V0S6_9PELO
MLPSRSVIARFCRLHSTASVSSIDAKEVEKFGDLSAEWSDELGSFHALHSLNRIRVPWIVDNVPKGSPSRLVDVGSGGGLLSIPLARSGFDVTGIDATRQAVDAARLALQAKPLQRAGISDRLRFEQTSVEDFCQKAQNKSAYDAVVASEIVEHVADLPGFISSLATLARPGAPLFITTINRTWLSKLAAIWLAENVLKIVPEGVHEWEKFVTPAELTSHLEKAGCRVAAIHGLMFHPIGNHWTWIESTQCNYAVLAVKK